MHHAIVATHDLLADAPIRLPQEETRHLRTVLRAKLGDELRLLDGAGHHRTAQVTELGKAHTLCEPRGSVSTLPHPAVSVTLFQCVAKPARMDWLVEKAAELGATRIVPIVSAHSVVHLADGAKPDRWRRIAESALRQSAGGWLLNIATPVKWAEAVAQMHAFKRPILVGALSAQARPLGDVLAAMRAQGAADEVGWLIGPEGDLSPSELNEALSMPTAIPVSLGAQVLRVETAALFGLSATLATLG